MCIYMSLVIHLAAFGGANVCQSANVAQLRLWMTTRQLAISCHPWVGKGGSPTFSFKPQ